MKAHFWFKNLFALSKSMKRKNLDYQVINDINYKKNLDICALFKFDYLVFKDKNYQDNSQSKIYTLGLFKRGTCEYLELPLKHIITDSFEKFEIPTMLENEIYQKLKVFLEINDSLFGVFKPIDFFEALHAAIPTHAHENNLDRQVCSHSYPTSKNNEKNKIYFLSFRNNDLRGDTRSLENYEKVQMLLPDANRLIGHRNISVCFTAEKKDGILEKQEYEDKFKEFK